MAESDRLEGDEALLAALLRGATIVTAARRLDLLDVLRGGPIGITLERPVELANADAAVGEQGFR